jgi:transposase
LVDILSSPLSLAPHLPISRDYKVTAAELVAGGLRVTADALTVATNCPRCSAKKLYAWGSRPVASLDLPYKGQPVEIHIQARRYRCGACKLTFSQPLPEIAETRSMTLRLLHWIGQEGQIRTFVSIAKDIGASEKTVRNAFNDFVQRLESMVHIRTPAFMALVEVAALDKKDRIAVINTHARTLVDLLPGPAAIGDYFSKLRDRQLVQFVATGLSREIYDAAASHLSAAVVFIDKPPVLALVDAALESVRTGMPAGHRQRMHPQRRRDLAKDREILLRPPHAQDAQDRSVLAQWCDQNPLLGEARQVWEAVHAIYAETVSPVVAAERMDSIVDGLSPGLRPSLQELVQAWASWRQPMLNYFRPGATQASAVALGDLSVLGGAIEHQGRGHAFEAVRCRLLYSPRIPGMTLSSPGSGVDRLLREAS